MEKKIHAHAAFLKRMELSLAGLKALVREIKAKKLRKK
jgi:hypothetical protein